MSLDPSAVEPLLRGRLGRPYRFVPECDSTQELVREHDPPEGAVLATDHQRAGRGRSGRSWEDAPGDALLFSLVLRPPLTPALPQLSLVVALAVAEAIEEATGASSGLKWPNDVEVGGRKVAGILLESSAGVVSCGIGVNVNQTAESLPAATRRPPGSLRLETGIRHDRAVLLATILASIERRYDTWRSEGLSPLRAALEGRSTVTGRWVRVAGRAGIATGIAADGRLEVHLAGGGGVLHVDSGDVEIA